MLASCTPPALQSATPGGQPVEEALEAGALDLHRLERVEPVADVGDRAAASCRASRRGAPRRRARAGPPCPTRRRRRPRRSASAAAYVLVGHGHDHAGCDSCAQPSQPRRLGSRGGRRRDGTQPGHHGRVVSVNVGRRVPRRRASLPSTAHRQAAGGPYRRARPRPQARRARQRRRRRRDRRPAPPRRPAPGGLRLRRQRTGSGGREQIGRPIAARAFGENLTTEGVELTHALVGELWTVGDAVLRVEVPRIPCATFAEHMGVPRWVRRFADAGRTGAYLSVVTPGTRRGGRRGAGRAAGPRHRPRSRSSARSRATGRGHASRRRGAGHRRRGAARPRAVAGRAAAG